MRKIVLAIVLTLSLFASPSFEELFQKQNIVMLLIDPTSGAIVDANPKAVEFYGYSKEELTSKTVEQINTLTPEQIKEEMSLARSQNRDYFIFQHQLKNGKVKRVEVQSSPYEFGKKQLLFSIIGDLSEDRVEQQGLFRYQARLEEDIAKKTKELQSLYQKERLLFFLSTLLLALFVAFLSYFILKLKRANQLVELEKKFQETLIDSMQSALIATDKDGLIMRFNKSAEKLLGYSAEELIGKKNAALFHDKEQTLQRAEAFSKELALDIKPGFQVFTIKTNLGLENTQEWIYRRKDDTKVEVELTITEFRGSDGEVLGYIGVATDITKRKKQEKALKESEYLFKTIFEAFPDSAIIIDPQTKLPYTFNEVAHKRLGYTKEEFSRLTINDYEALEEPEETKKRIHEIQEVGFSNFETQHITKSKEIIHVDVSVQMIELFKKPFLFAVFRDITKLKEAKTKAEEANRSKSEFLANMSHEIRTPMNAVIGFSQMLGELELQKEQKDLVEKINSSSRILLGIINDILDYSKIEAGKLELEIEALSLNHVVSQLWVMFEQRAKEKNVTLFIDEDEQLPAFVFSDELRLTQVLTNLLSNALKFTENGEVKLFIGLKEKISDTQVLISFSVQDTGIGMSKAQKHKLFQPFSQADSSTTRKYGGTGLGLVITKNIIKAFGSEIVFESKEGVGTTVGFELEMKVQSWNGKEMQPVLEEKEQSFVAFDNLEVLLVEDNEINQEVASMMLESVGIKVTTANNGQEGVDTYLANLGKYHLVLMDLQMPVLSGYDAARKIREHNQTVPIIALTAAAMIEDRQKVLDAGMNDHLSKPIDKQELFRVIKAFTSKEVEVSSQKRSTGAIIDLETLNDITNSEELAYTLLQKLQSQLETGEFADIIQQIQNNTSNAHTLVHTLKGVSGNVGAKELYAVCLEIDKKYKQNQSITDEDSKKVENAIENFLTKVKSL